MKSHDSVRVYSYSRRNQNEIQKHDTSHSVVRLAFGSLDEVTKNNRMRVSAVRALTLIIYSVIILVYQIDEILIPRLYNTNIRGLSRL